MWMSWLSLRSGLCHADKPHMHALGLNIDDVWRMDSTRSKVRKRTRCLTVPTPIFARRGLCWLAMPIKCLHFDYLVDACTSALHSGVSITKQLLAPTPALRRCVQDDAYSAVSYRDLHSNWASCCREGGRTRPVFKLGEVITLFSMPQAKLRFLVFRYIHIRRLLACVSLLCSQMLISKPLFHTGQAG
ncbi:hypothetical protein K402DRAFT_270869 [Aulographum hederae CBS 113979]|uniref:Uncharacterized protein n=1 Tax=Aulographum hederae CBS 113979 TaxID=1176131 RepID=A0A6G1H8L2_9PEZI|nr:hypothetical protein K402DRAFT_270869 [Aulographum hederae CBS 113979]